ncbi:hypothetical protein YC2023_045339 [Brassica napus]
MQSYDTRKSGWSKFLGPFVMLASNTSQREPVTVLRSRIMKKQKTYDHNGDRTDSNITPETIKSKKTFSNAIQFCSNYIKNPDIPLRSVYYRLFEGIENRIVPCNTYSLYHQVSMPSPQTPRNIRRLQLGIDTPTDQILTTPKQSSCLTSSKSRDVGSEQLSTTSKQQDRFRSKI